MIKQTQYRIAVAEDTDFFEGWVDPAIPNVVFLFDQESLEECEEIDGVYYATYQSWVVETEHQMTYIEAGREHVVNVAIGEYGKLPQNENA
jgi:hypothetical protein